MKPNTALVGTRIGKTQIGHIDDLEQNLRDAPPRLAVLAVPRAHAPEVAERLEAWRDAGADELACVIQDGDTLRALAEVAL